jgi:hypothetical protein
LGAENLAADVDMKQFFELLRRDVFQHGMLGYAGIVDQNVKPAQKLCGFVNHLPAGGDLR